MKLGEDDEKIGKCTESREQGRKVFLCLVLPLLFFFFFFFSHLSPTQNLSRFLFFLFFLSFLTRFCFFPSPFHSIFFGSPRILFLAILIYFSIFSSSFFFCFFCFVFLFGSFLPLKHGEGIMYCGDHMSPIINFFDFIF